MQVTPPVHLLSTDLPSPKPTVYKLRCPRVCVPTKSSGCGHGRQERGTHRTAEKKVGASRTGQPFSPARSSPFESPLSCGAAFVLATSLHALPRQDSSRPRQDSSRLVGEDFLRGTADDLGHQLAVSILLEGDVGVDDGCALVADLVDVLELVRRGELTGYRL